MTSASRAAQELKEARNAEAHARHPAAEAHTRNLQEKQAAEFHGPTTAMLDALQPFNVEGGEGEVHQMTARHAQAAVTQALQDAGRHLVKAGDIRPLVRKHPWLTLGGATAVGFATAAAIMVSKRTRTRRTKQVRTAERALEQALLAELPPRRPGGKRRTVGRLLNVGWRLARPAVWAIVSGAVSQATSRAVAGAGAGGNPDGSPPAERDYPEGPVGSF